MINAEILYSFVKNFVKILAPSRGPICATKICILSHKDKGTNVHNGI